MTDLANSPAPEAGASTLRVMTEHGPLGTIRLTVRAIGEADGFVFCRHGSLRPVVVTRREWQALPPATDDNFDV